MGWFRLFAGEGARATRPRHTVLLRFRLDLRDNRTDTLPQREAGAESAAAANFDENFAFA